MAMKTHKPANKIRGEVEVEIGGEKRTLVLDFARMLAVEEKLGKEWSLVKITRNTVDEWNIPIHVTVSILDVAAEEEGFGVKLMEEIGVIHASATATALVVNSVMGSRDAKKEQSSGKEDESESQETKMKDSTT